MYVSEIISDHLKLRWKKEIKWVVKLMIIFITLQNLNDLNLAFNITKANYCLKIEKLI